MNDVELGSLYDRLPCSLHIEIKLFARESGLESLQVGRGEAYHDIDIERGSRFAIGHAGDRASERVGEVQIFENGDEMTEKISRLQRNVSERSPDRPDPARVPRNRSSESLGGRGPVLSCRAQPLFDDQRTWHDRFRAVGGPEAPRLVLDHPCWEASLWEVRRTTQSPLVDREGDSIHRRAEDP